MTDLRAAAQQALDCLEWHYRQGHSNTLGGFRLKIDEKALRKLRAALAEPVQEPVLVVEKEPDYWSRGHFHEGSRSHIDPTKVWGLPIGTKLYDAPPQRPAEPVEPVEPVAWTYTGVKSDGSEHGPHLVWRPEYMDAMSASKGAKAMPLYAAPPQRKPLTDEEIDNEANNIFTDDPVQWWRRLARAIEAAHGIRSKT